MSTSDNVQEPEQITQEHVVPLGRSMLRPLHPSSALVMCHQRNLVVEDEAKGQF